MKCVICGQGETGDGFTTVIIGQVLSKNVPAQICSFCGEAHVDEAVTARLLRNAENLSQAKTTESDYSEESPEKILANNQATILARIRQRRAYTLNVDAPDSLTLLREDRDR